MSKHFCLRKAEALKDTRLVGTVWVGTSGFSYKEWKPSFYPADLRPDRFLEFYSSVFPAVEIDSTFYRMPNQKTLDTWRLNTPHRFRFAIKVSQQITHRERLKQPSDALTYLAGAVERLEDKLGCMLFQLPPNFKKDVARLEGLLIALPRPSVAVFEFRHESWFDGDVYALLSQRGAGLCIHDADEHTTPVVRTGGVVYVRLRKSAYPDDALRVWSQRLREMAGAGADVLAFIKHEDNPEAPHLARMLRDLCGS